MSTSPSKHEETPKDGNMPQYITQVPWYVDNKESAETLNHQKFLGEPKKTDINEWYDRGKRGQQATSYRKGACENCGAMGHNRKECTERPRKTGIKFQIKDIAADDVTKNITLNWEGKRDRWMGFDPATHKELVGDEYEAEEEIKKKRKIEPDSEFKNSTNPIEIAQLPRRNDPISIKTFGLSGTRNREDISNYLINLESTSAPYHPKTRLMADNPTPHLPEEEQLYKGHNAFLNSGEQLELLEQDRFVLQQAELQNSELNSVALPSLTEHVFKTMMRKNQILNSGRTGELLKRYGGSEYIDNKPEQIIENEAYKEYDLDGTVKKQPGKSRYPEDVYINDHTSVWGSWWNQFLGWGYTCCHNNLKMSMCNGTKGHQLALQKETRLRKEKLKQEIE